MEIILDSKYLGNTASKDGVEVLVLPHPVTHDKYSRQDV